MSNVALENTAGDTPLASFSGVLSPYKSVRPLIFGALTLLLAPHAVGQEAQRARDDSAISSLGSSSALQTLTQFASSLPNDSPALVVLGLLPESAQTVLSPQARESLTHTLLGSVASAVPQMTMRGPSALDLPAARTLARRRSLSLVFLQPELNAGQLTLKAQIVKWPRSFWQRSLKPEGSITHRAHISVKAESFLRPFIPPAQALLQKSQKIRHTVASPLAVACDDVDHDGQLDIFLVGRHEVQRGTITGGKFIVQSRRTWAQLSPIAPAPLRAPLAGISTTKDGVWLGSSDRKNLLLLDQNLAPLKVFSRAQPLERGRCAPYSDSGLLDQSYDCQQTPAPQKQQSSSLNLFTETSFSEADLSQSTLQAFQPLSSSEVQISVERVAQGELRLTLKDSGDQVIFDDLDGDGKVEVISSSSNEQQDAIRVHRIVDNSLSEVMSKPSKAIFALTSCPFEGSYPKKLISVSEHELEVF